MGVVRVLRVRSIRSFRCGMTVFGEELHSDDSMRSTVLVMISQSVSIFVSFPTFRQMTKMRLPLHFLYERLGTRYVASPVLEMILEPVRLRIFSIASRIRTLQLPLSRCGGRVRSFGVLSHSGIVDSVVLRRRKEGGSGRFRRSGRLSRWSWHIRYRSDGSVGDWRSDRRVD